MTMTGTKAVSHGFWVRQSLKIRHILAQNCFARLSATLKIGPQSIDQDSEPGENVFLNNIPFLLVRNCRSLFTGTLIFSSGEMRNNSFLIAAMDFNASYPGR